MESLRRFCDLIRKRQKKRRRLTTVRLLPPKNTAAFAVRGCPAHLRRSIFLKKALGARCGSACRKINDARRTACCCASERGGCGCLRLKRKRKHTGAAAPARRKRSRLQKRTAAAHRLSLLPAVPALLALAAAAAKTAFARRKTMCRARMLPLLATAARRRRTSHFAVG
jgi:hypothetical protein